MAPAPAKALSPRMQVVESIRQEILAAVTELLHRVTSRLPNATSISKADLVIEDDKEDLPKSGCLQDCEFGMILLLARDWFQDQNFHEELFASPAFEQVVLALVERVADRVLQVDNTLSRTNEGGEGKRKQDGTLTTFFTGEPYTKSPGKLTKYSANIDSAMITVAFLGPAVKQYDRQLANCPYKPQGLPAWVQNLRDAAVFIILDGLRYALDCRIIVDKGCQGFTSDPATRDKYPADGGFNAETTNDRLFFTWTACETINDITAWQKEYLEHAASVLPQPAVSDLNPLIEQLQESLDQAAAWLKKSKLYYENFRTFVIPNTEKLVSDGWADERKDQFEKIEKAVQHVYHLSQYGAIRSLVPEDLDLAEVLTVVNKLDQLVRVSIMDSGLDASQDEYIFRTLTRNYGLGSSARGGQKYADDAWYPLVVRSLSGLLSRTLKDFERRFLRSDVETLVDAFEKSLVLHYQNLLKRRPAGSDGKLWSFAVGKPYVLYATQRTIFALMTYVDFLTAVDRFLGGDGDVDIGKWREELIRVAATKFADEIFGPTVDKILNRIKPGSQVDLHGADPTGRKIAMPVETWAAAAMSAWLSEITGDFDKIVTELRQRANIIISGQNAIDSAPKTSMNTKSFLNCEHTLTEIKQFGAFGEGLQKLGVWECQAVINLLFEYLFEEHFRLLDVFDDKKPDKEPKLFATIRRFLQNQNSLTSSQQGSDRR